MVGIEGPRRLDRADPVRPRPPRAAAPGFVMAGDGAAAAAAPVPMAALSPAMLALQEVDETPERQGRRHGRALLSALARLQAILLAGGDPDTALGELRALLAALPEVTDPGLGSVLAAVALRARVELARRGAV